MKFALWNYWKWNEFSEWPNVPEQFMKHKNSFFGKFTVESHILTCFDAIWNNDKKEI